MYFYKNNENNINTFNFDANGVRINYNDHGLPSWEKRIDDFAEGIITNFGTKSKIIKREKDEKVNINNSNSNKLIKVYMLVDNSETIVDNMFCIGQFVFKTQTENECKHWHDTSKSLFCGIHSKENDAIFATKNNTPQLSSTKLSSMNSFSSIGPNLQFNQSNIKYDHV